MHEHRTTRTIQVNSAVQCKLADDSTTPAKKQTLGAGCTSATLDDVMADFKWAYRHIIGPTLLGNAEFVGSGGAGGNGGNATSTVSQEVVARSRSRRRDAGGDGKGGDAEEADYCEGADCVYMLVPRESNGRGGPRRFFGAIGTLIVVGNDYGRTPKGAKLKLSHAFQENCASSKHEMGVDLIPPIHEEGDVVPADKSFFFHLEAFQRISIEDAAARVKKMRTSEVPCRVRTGGVQEFGQQLQQNDPGMLAERPTAEQEQQSTGGRPLHQTRENTEGKHDRSGIPWGAASFNDKIAAFASKCGTPEHASHATAGKDQRGERIERIKAIDAQYFGGILAADSKLMMEGGLVTRFPPGRLQTPSTTEQQRQILEDAQWL